jgi:hypothetical protein
VIAIASPVEDSAVRLTIPRFQGGLEFGLLAFVDVGPDWDWVSTAAVFLRSKLFAAMAAR